jgi:hypothetical protein
MKKLIGEGRKKLRKLSGAPKKWPDVKRKNFGSGLSKKRIGPENRRAEKKRRACWRFRSWK